MEPLLRSSLVILATLSLCGGAAVLARPSALPAGAPQGAARRLDRVGLLLHHGVALGVALAAALGALLGGGDGRPLLLCAAGPLLVLCLQDAVPPRVALWSVPLVAAGLLVQALVLLEVAPAALAGPACAAVAGLACAAGAAAAWRQRRTQLAPRARALGESQALALALAAFAGALGLLPTGLGHGVWAVAVGAAGAVGTAGRLSPSAPPGGKELVATTVCALLVGTAAAAAGQPVSLSLIIGAAVALLSLAVFSLVRASFSLAPRPTPVVLDEAAAGLGAPLPSPAALGAMNPLLDDALLRRPSRPRVIARVPARRLLDAALDKARSAQPAQRGRRDDLLRVDVVAGDPDIDVDGDPADLAEALCAVLDNALRARAAHPDVQVVVHLRGSAAAVTFEVADVLADGAEPTPVAAIPDADAPFFAPRADSERPGLGVALARARLLIERNGGKLFTRSSPEGSFVQVTMPRRMHKGAVGQA